jgi:hypothetical protein
MEIAATEMSEYRPYQGLAPFIDSFLTRGHHRIVVSCVQKDLELQNSLAPLDGLPMIVSLQLNFGKCV